MIKLAITVYDANPVIHLQIPAEVTTYVIEIDNPELERVLTPKPGERLIYRTISVVDEIKTEG